MRQAQSIVTRCIGRIANPAGRYRCYGQGKSVPLTVHFITFWIKPREVTCRAAGEAFSQLLSQQDPSVLSKHEDVFYPFQIVSQGIYGIKEQYVATWSGVSRVPAEYQQGWPDKVRKRWLVRVSPEFEGQLEACQHVSG